MKSQQKILAAAAAFALLLGITFSAQSQPEPEEDAAPADPTPELTTSLSPELEVSPDEMEHQGEELTKQSAADQTRIDQLKAEARKQKDILKLNCINDKLVQVKQLLNIFDDALSRLQLAIATGDDPERYHRYTIITVAAEKIRNLRDEAEACVGDELSYLGPLDLDVDEPDVLDDPTTDDPFDDFDIEPPGYASPFF